MNFNLFCILFFALTLTSCIVQSPKFTSLDKVIALQIGMSKNEVEDLLGLEPYDLKALTDSSKTYIYIYRVKNRRTFSFDTKSVNGSDIKGKYVQLAIEYSNKGMVKHIESCSLCPDNLVSTSKIDFEKIFVFVTVTLPIILLYLGLK